MKNIMCFFLIGGIVQVFRLHQEEIESLRIMQMASMVVSDGDCDFPMAIKDRWNLFNPLAYPVTTESQVLKWLDGLNELDNMLR